MADRDEFGAFLVGFIVGGITGAVTALLLAPQSGEETRTVIKEKTIELKDKASKSVEDAYEQAEAAALQARSKFDELASMTKEKTEELQRKGQVLLEEQKSKLGDALQGKKKTEGASSAE